MKKLLYLLVFLTAGIGYAQIPQEAQITQAQLENSRVVKERTDKFNALVDQKVDKIMSLSNLDKNQRGALQEIVMDKESQTINIQRENISDVMKQSKTNAVLASFKSQLMNLLGEDKFNLVKNIIGSK